MVRLAAARSGRCPASAAAGRSARCSWRSSELPNHPQRACRNRNGNHHPAEGNTTGSHTARTVSRSGCSTSLSRVHGPAPGPAPGAVFSDDPGAAHRTGDFGSRRSRRCDCPIFALAGSTGVATSTWWPRLCSIREVAVADHRQDNLGQPALEFGFLVAEFVPGIDGKAVYHAYRKRESEDRIPRQILGAHDVSGVTSG